MRTVGRTQATRGAQGVSLVELMVALVLSLFLILGAVTAYEHCRRAYDAAERMARLQEVARLALAVLETDIRMASYWGLARASYLIVGRAVPGQATAFTAQQEARIDYCGGPDSNWAINLDEYIGGSNNAYGLACPAYHDAPVGMSDVLVLRRANQAVIATLDPNRLHVQSSRTHGALFVPMAGCTSADNVSCLPASFTPATSQAHVLETRAYYVATDSTSRTGLPSLRRKSFGNVNAAAVGDAMTDDEIATGVEDLQVRFGIDTDGDLNADAYVNPGAVTDADLVISARIWLRVRAEDAESGFVDGASYQYADMASTFTPDDRFRRLVLSRTIQLRNAGP